MAGAGALVDALEAEAARTGGFLRTLDVADWDLPTRCPPMNMLDLASHTLRGGLRLAELAVDTSGAEPEKDAVTYFRYDPVAVGAGVVERAKAEAANRTGPSLVAEWEAAWAEAIAKTRANTGADAILVSPMGTIRLHEYVRTRCVEITIHTMDLRDAKGLAPDPTRPGLAATCDVLRGLLGADTRSLGIDEIHFALVGTGRAALTDDDRERLGPLADLFPLLR